MERLTKRKEAVLDVLDEQIEQLEEKLARVQPLINELNQLKQTRATLLRERGTTGGGAREGQLTMEEVVHWLTEHGPASPQEIAAGVGYDAHRVRSHLSRHKNERYVNVSNGTWGLVEQDVEEEEE
jgi:TolA-binding protein